MFLYNRGLCKIDQIHLLDTRISILVMQKNC